MNTFLEFIACADRSSCGYCKNERGERRTESVKKDEEGAGGESGSAPIEAGAGEQREERGNNVTTGGAWAHNMLTDDYAALLDMGWRRSGRYLYKPHNELTCCPQYTIRLDVTKFKMSRSQKRVMRQMNEFLATGKRPDRGEDREEKEPSSSSQVARPQTSPSSCSSSSSSEPSVEPVAKKTKDADRPVLKKKEIRNKKFEERCRARNMDPDVVRAERREKEAARQRTVKSYIDEARPDWKHKLELKLVRLGTEEIKTRDNESFELYKKYQATVHNEESHLAGFRRFLCDSPLQHETRHGVDFGSYHLWFLLDDKLIAVCVLDVLPKCISAKYMYYDPDYSFLSMGTYTALREIDQTQHLHSMYPELQYYYMGYYIHSCPKMRYKAKFHPSDLLCDYSLKWLDYESCKPKFDSSAAPNGYTVFRPDDRRPEGLPVADMLVMTHGMITRLERALALRPQYADNPELTVKTQTIANLVGPNIPSTVFYFNELNEDE